MRINIVKNKDKNFPHEHGGIVSSFSLLFQETMFLKIQVKKKVQVIFLIYTLYSILFIIISGWHELLHVNFSSRKKKNKIET